VKKVFVGIYDIGYERVRLYLTKGSGAGTSFLPDDKGITLMEIGADQDKYRKVVASLLHEAQEMSMCRLGLSFYPYGSLNGSTANCTFVMNHEQFDECCGRSGELIVAIGADLYHAWKKWKTNKVKK